MRTRVVLLAALVALVVGLVFWSRSTPTPDLSVQREPPAARDDLGHRVDPVLKALRARARESDAGMQLAAAHPQPAQNVVARFGWGSGEGQLGRNRPESGNPEGPMSLAVGPNGQVVVLDQVNERLVRLGPGGKVVGSTPLPVRGAQDVTVAPDGTSLVLDRLLDKSVALVGPDGKVAGTLAVEGPGIPEGGAVTGVFADGKDVYVEREHADQVKLGVTSGEAAAARDEVPGRLSKDGTLYLTAGISEPGGSRVYLMAIERANRAPRFSREYQMGTAVLALDLLDTDRSGIIYLGAVVAPDGEPAMIDLMCLDPLDGRPLGFTRIPANESADETFKELVVPDEGGVLYLYRTEEGAELRRYDCR